MVVGVAEMISMAVQMVSETIVVGLLVMVSEITVRDGNGSGVRSDHGMVTGRGSGNDRDGGGCGGVSCTAFPLGA